MVQNTQRISSSVNEKKIQMKFLKFSYIFKENKKV